MDRGPWNTACLEACQRRGTGARASVSILANGIPVHNRLRPTYGMLEQPDLPFGRPGEERPRGGLFDPRPAACTEVLEDLETHDVGGIRGATHGTRAGIRRRSEARRSVSGSKKLM